MKLKKLLLILVIVLTFLTVSEFYWMLSCFADGATWETAESLYRTKIPSFITDITTGAWIRLVLTAISLTCIGYFLYHRYKIWFNAVLLLINGIVLYLTLYSFM